MTARALAGIALVALAGCARIQAILTPSTRPAPASIPAPGPAAPTPALPGAPATPAPGAPTAPSLGVPTPAPVPSATVPPPMPPPPPPTPAPGATPSPLTPQLPTAQARRFRLDAERKLDETDRILRQFEGRPLKPKDRETLLLAQSFIDQARKALATQEYERAANLAAKARTLTDDLTASTK